MRRWPLVLAMLAAGAMLSPSVPAAGPAAAPDAPGTGPEPDLVVCTSPGFLPPAVGRAVCVLWFNAVWTPCSRLPLAFACLVLT